MSIILPNFKPIVFLSLCLGLIAGVCAKDGAVNLELIEGIYYPTSEIQVYESESQKLLIGDIQKLNTNQWQTFDASKELFPDRNYWFKLLIERKNLNQTWLITPGLWHYSQIFFKDEQQQWQSQNLSVFEPLAKREVKHQYPFAVIKPSLPTIEIYIKARGFRYGRPPTAQHLWIVSEKYLTQKSKDELHFQGGFLGFAFGLAGFHLILWFWFREKTYLWLVAAGMSSPIFFHALYGYGLTQLWPSLPVWNEYSPSVLGNIAAAVYLRFGVCYLNLSTHMPRLEKIITVLLYASLFTGLAVFQQTKWLLSISPLILMISALTILVASIQLSVKGIRYAWYFVAGNALVLLSFVLWALLQVEIINPESLLISVQNVTQMATGIQGIFLALGMIDRMQSMKQTILESKLQQEKLVRMQAEQTQRLMQVQNAELASANFALKEVDQLKDEFLAKTSHELNTPLNGIIGLSEILLDEQNAFSEKEKKEYLELIASRGEHLRELVVELLEFAQTRRDVVQLYPEQINVETHIKKIILTFIQAAQKKNIELSFNENEQALVYVDARRFRQIISILIDNAIKYTDSGSIQILLSSDEQYTTIKVIDTGIGISEEDLPHVYEPFKQVVDKQRTREGAGLGLSICKHLVELHDGYIDISSIVGKGTTFTIVLPVEKDFSKTNSSS